MLLYCRKLWQSNHCHRSKEIKCLLFKLGSCWHMVYPLDSRLHVIWMVSKYLVLFLLRTSATSEGFGNNINKAIPSSIPTSTMPRALLLSIWILSHFHLKIQNCFFLLKMEVTSTISKYHNVAYYSQIALWYLWSTLCGSAAGLDFSLLLILSCTIIYRDLHLELSVHTSLIDY